MDNAVPAPSRLLVAARAPVREHTRVPAELYALAAATLSLCLCDALFTLSLIESGYFYEANPAMQTLMSIDTRLFVLAKMGVTACALAVLLRHCHRSIFRFLRVTHVLLATFFFYLLLVGYEVSMLTLLA